MKKFAGLVLALSLGCGSIGRAEEGSWAKELVPDAVGTRVTQYWLLDTSREKGDTFLGSIDGLDARQDLWPYKVFAQWNLGSHAFLEGTWDRVEAVAQSEHGKGDSDGTLEMYGPVLTLNGRLPTGTRFTPFAGIGLAPWRANFDHASWHHYGYESVAEWKADGSPTEPRNGKVRHINVDDSVGYVATLGVDVALGKDWVLDFYGRYMDISTDHQFTVDQGHTRLINVEGAFPLDNIAIGIGLARTF